MAGGLPEGLVSNKKGVTVGIEEAARLEAEDTLKLWRSMVLPEPRFRLTRQLTVSFASLLVRERSHCRKRGPKTQEFFLEDCHERACTGAFKWCTDRKAI